MEKATLNNELDITFPEGFHVMDKEEMEKHKYVGEAPGWCITDPERHIVVSVSWKKINGLAARLLNTKDIAKRMETGIRAAMSQYGYKFEEFISLKPGGKNADGYRYSYTVQETGMSGQSLCIKNGSTFYYVHCYYRTLLKEESLALLDGIMNSFSWT